MCWVCVVCVPGHWWCGDGMAHGDADGAVALMARRLLSELMRVVALGLATGDDKAEAAVLEAWDEAAGKLRLCQDWCVLLGSQPSLAFVPSIVLTMNASHLQRCGIPY